MPSEHGTVVAGFGRDCLVRTGCGLVSGKARSRRVQPVCGDRVMLSGTVIEAVAARANAFSRSSEHRTKVIAANVDQVVMLVAVEPSFSDELVCRVLVAAAHAAIPVLLVLNKIDLEARRAEARCRIEPFVAAEVPAIELAAKFDAQALLPHLAGRRSVLVGQSGMGKSTLIRKLVPDAEVRIGEISRFLDAGRQSTTAARLYALEGRTEIVDTPGFSEFGLAGIRAREIAAGFREFAPYAAHCRFSDCRHLAEPGCAVRAAAQSGAIHRRRLDLYERIVNLEHAR